MRRALIGHTGFVGSNLDAPGRFAGRYNSSTIEELAGGEFDEVWCAGVQAVKWWANQNPEQDWMGIRRLMEPLARVTCRRFVLISTVDIYPEPIGVDEDSPVSEAGHHAYGLHRLRLERFIAERFASCQILRLPGLYGKGLKKNLIFDVLSERPIDGFDAASTFQFYGLDQLWDDAQRAHENKLMTLNVAVEPVSVAAVVTALTARSYTHRTAAPPVAYDMQTRFASIWSRPGRYLQTAEETLAGITSFAETFRAQP